MPPTPSLPLIVAHARAGAPAQAWRLFREAGLEGVGDDAGVMAVRGRLLKEDALGAVGAARETLLAQAASAYGAAASLSASSYHLINAASLSLLAGDAAASRAAAIQVLAGLDQRPDEAETPYWLGATRAEALLLLNRQTEARAALTDAVALAPRAWEDHASTLRQFRLICAAQGMAADWLDALRPPRTLHFAGHMSLSAEGSDLRHRVAEVLVAENVGFGFGALAAGADIVVAGALVEHGAELNLVLPAAPSAFRAASVARQGEDWGRRYDALVALAASVIDPERGERAPDRLAVQLAGEVAMGQAAMRAGALQTEALQLLVLDLDERGGVPGGSGWVRDHWAASGRRQVIIQAPRAGRAARAIPEPGAQEQLLALLVVATDPAKLPMLAQALAEAPPPITPPNWSGRALVLAYADTARAAEAIDVIRAVVGLDAAIAGAYGIAASLTLPGLPAPLVTGAVADRAIALVGSVPASACHLDVAFATSLCAAQPMRRVELICDLDLPGSATPIEVYALGG